MGTRQEDDWLAGETAAAASAAGAGLIVGTAAGGPVGAIAGAALGPPILRAFRRLDVEMTSRGIGRRQGARMNVTAMVALEQIAERLRRGEEPRTDYLKDYAGDRSSAEELLEEATRIAGDSADERKAPLLGRLYASLLFSPDLTPAHGRYMHRLVERLTYRQLVGLIVIADAADFRADPFMERYHEIIDAGNYAELEPGIGLELDDLADRHLIGVVERPEKRKDWVGHEPKVNSPYGLWGGDSPDSIWQQSIGRVRATPMGRRLAGLYGEGLSREEREAWLTDAWRMVSREGLDSEHQDD